MTFNLLDFIPQDQHAAIFSGAGVYADDGFAAAIAQGVALGTIPAIQLPAGRLKFARTIHLKRMVKLLGHGGGLATSTGHKPSTVFQFDRDKSGIVIHRYDTNDGVVENPPTTAADGTIIEGVRLEGSGTTGHGIHMRARATVRDCQINKFGGNGVHIVADAASSHAEVHGNANGWYLDALRVTSCGGHGVFCDNGDSNAGVGILVDVTGNKGWGIYDSSFLGNTWIGCHSAGNTLGAYKSDNTNARGVFIGCYSEGGQPKSEINGRSLILGGLHGAGVSGGQRIWEGGLTPFKVKGANHPENGERAVEYRLGMYPFSGLDIAAEGDHQHGWSLGWWDESTGTVAFCHARLRRALRLTTDLTTLLDDATGTPIPPGQVAISSVWATSATNRCRKIDFLDLLTRIEALEANTGS